MENRERAAESRQRHDRQSGVALLTVVVVVTVVLLMSGAMLTLVNVNASSEFSTETDLQSEYLAVAAFSRAFAEIVSFDDPDLDGLGALGIEAPLEFEDSEGRVVGEFITLVREESDRQILVALAAVPSFAEPQSVRVVEGALESTLDVAIRPGEAAITVSGPVASPDLNSWGDGTLIIDGGLATAMVISDVDAYETLASEILALIEAGTIPDTALIGDITGTYTDGFGTDHELPIVQEAVSGLSATELDDFRNDLRESVLDLADLADETITEALIGDQTWGTPNTPLVVVIDSTSPGSDGVFVTEGQTISGYGTLIFKHAVEANRNLNLDWTGDVFVVGFDGDGSQLFSHDGTQGTIEGSLVLLASDSTEASMDLRESSVPEVGDGAERGSDLTVIGNVLALAESGSQEAEVEVEDASRLQVDGVLSMYGSRVELQTIDVDSEIVVEGSVALGMARDLVDIERAEDLEIRVDGTLSVTWNQALVDQAMEGLGGMLADFDPLLEDETVINRFTIAGIRARSKPGMVALDEVYARLADVSLEDHGVDITAID